MQAPQQQEAVLDALLDVSSVLLQDLSQFAAGHGMSESRLHLLWELHSGGGLVQRRLADLLGVTPRTVTGLVDALVASGHVQRTPHPVDRRSTVVVLTAAGVRFAADLVAMRSTLAAQLLGDLSARELDVLSTAMPRVAGTLRALVAGAGTQSPA